MLISVDLGKRKVGIASWYVHSDPREASLLATETVSLRGRWTAARMAECVFQSECIAAQLPLVWVCEWPQKYENRRSTWKNIEELWEVGKFFSWAERYQPRQWKGNVPKQAFRSRIRRTLRKDELAIMPPEDEHDAWDAVGIGLYALARFGRGGIEL